MRRNFSRLWNKKKEIITWNRKIDSLCNIAHLRNIFVIFRTNMWNGATQYSAFDYLRTRDCARYRLHTNGFFTIELRYSAGFFFKRALRVLQFRPDRSFYLLSVRVTIKKNPTGSKCSRLYFPRISGLNLSRVRRRENDCIVRHTNRYKKRKIKPGSS